MARRPGVLRGSHLVKVGTRPSSPLLLCNSCGFVLSIASMRPTDLCSPFVALVVAALATGCPSKGQDGEHPAPAPTSSPPAAARAARSGYRSHPVENGGTVEVRVRYLTPANGTSH